MEFEKLEKILGIITLTGALTLGAGCLFGNRDLKYFGIGETLAGLEGYIIDYIGKEYILGKKE